jgi:hypothetical protein
MDVVTVAMETETSGISDPLKQNTRGIREPVPKI